MLADSGAKRRPCNAAWHGKLGALRFFDGKQQQQQQQQQRQHPKCIQIYIDSISPSYKIFPLSFVSLSLVGLTQFLGGCRINAYSSVLCARNTQYMYELLPASSLPFLL